MSETSKSVLADCDMCDKQQGQHLQLDEARSTVFTLARELEVAERRIVELEAQAATARLGVLQEAEKWCDSIAKVTLQNAQAITSGDAARSRALGMYEAFIQVREYLRTLASAVQTVPLSLALDAQEREPAQCSETKRVASVTCVDLEQAVVSLRDDLLKATIKLREDIAWGCELTEMGKRTGVFSSPKHNDRDRKGEENGKDSSEAPSAGD